MGFIDINNIEQLTTSGGGSDWIKAVITVVGGFALKSVYDGYLKRKERKDVAEVFELQLISFKDVIKNQIKEIDAKLALIERFEYGSLTIHFTNKFNLIKSLSQLTLVKYYKKKHKDDASNYVSKIYNNIEIIILEVDRLTQGQNNYSAESNNFLKHYKEALDVVRRHAAVQADSLTHDQLKQEVIFQAFVQIMIQYFQDKPITPEYLMSIKNELHMKLIQPPFDKNSSPMYQHIFEFNSKGRDIIQHFEWKANDYKNVLRVVRESLIGIYKSIYKEDLIL